MDDLVMNNVVDDFSSDTDTTGILEVGGSATGTTDFRFDEDWFAIDIAAGETIRIASGGRDINLILRDEFGNIVAFDQTDFDTNETFLIAHGGEGGRFYVDVRGFTTPLNYTLTATAIEDDFANNLSTNGILEAGTETTGSIEYNGDYDWFAIDLSAGDTIRVSTADVDANMIVRDGVGNFVVYEQRDYEANEDFIILESTEDGTFYIDVSSSNSTQDYTLTVTELDDDFVGNAATTGSLEVGATTSGSINFYSDRDWFAINLTAGDAIRIASAGFDANLRLIDESGNVVAYDISDFENNESALILQVRDSGTFYVDVSSNSSTLDYDLTVTQLEDDFTNNMSTTGVLEIGTDLTGAINFYGDQDWFAIDLIAGETIRIASDSVNANLRLWNDSGDFIEYSYNDHTTDESVIVAQVAEGGTFFVAVSGYYISELDYTLSVTEIEDSFIDNSNTTGVLTAGASVTSSIDFYGDRDWLAIEAIAGETLRISTSDIEANLVLVDDIGNSVAYDQRDYTLDENFIVFEVEESGTLYVVVSSYSSEVDYTLTATVLEDDFAGNASTTGVLNVGSSVTGAIEFTNDEDWFAIDLTAGDAIRIGTGNYNMNLILVDDAGNRIAYDRRDYEANEDHLIAQVAEGGTYFVAVTSYNTTTDYTLTVTELEDDFANSAMTTGVLEVGGMVTGSVDFIEDQDWFAITVSDTDASIRFAVDNTSVDLSIFDADGNVVTYSTEGQSINFAEAGTYFVAATSSYTSSGNYTISSFVMESVEATRVVRDTRIIDTVADQANNITYSLTNGGTLIRYSNTSESELPALELGVNTSALSLSQDGRYLFAAQAELTDVGNGVFEATVFRIDAQTLAIESFSFQVTGNGYEITDIQAVADGSLFVTTDFPGSGWVPLYQLSGFDGVFSADIVSGVGSGFNGVRQNTTMDVSRDGQFLLLVESNSSGYPASIFSVEDDAVISSTGHGGFNGDRNAISGEAGLVALAAYNRVTLYDFDFNSVADLTYIFGNAERVNPVFSSNGEYLFLVNEVTYGDSSIAIVNTSSFEIESRIDLPENISTIVEIDMSPDGLNLVITDVSGVHYLDFSDTLAISVEGTLTSETIAGTEFSDVIAALGGNDIIEAGGGNDVIEGGAGGDVIDGGAGFDTATYEGSTNRVVINMAINSITSGHATGDSLISIENLTGSNFGDVITGNASDNVISGLNGADILSGFKGDDTLDGGAGNDLLTGGEGADTIDGGEGNSDMARYFGSNEGVVIDLGAGIASGGHADGDVISNVEHLFGSAHADTLTGDSANNYLFGSSGDDTLDGASGIDKLFGGTGVDTFVFGAGDDFAYVADWQDDTDVLDLSQYNFSSVQEALENMDQRGDHVRFFVDGETMLILNANLDDMVDDILI